MTQTTFYIKTEPPSSTLFFAKFMSRNPTTVNHHRSHTHSRTKSGLSFISSFFSLLSKPSDFSSLPCDDYLTLTLSPALRLLVLPSLSEYRDCKMGFDPDEEHLFTSERKFQIGALSDCNEWSLSSVVAITLVTVPRGTLEGLVSGNTGPDDWSIDPLRHSLRVTDLWVARVPDVEGHCRWVANPHVLKSVSTRVNQEACRKTRSFPSRL